MPASATSYLGKTFTIESGDARLRQPANLLKFITYEAGDALPAGKKIGDPKIIPPGTQIQVTNAKAIDRRLIFVRAKSGGEVLGWTAALNLVGGFVNETIGRIVPTGDDKKGVNAVWQQGKYLGQKVLVEIVGTKNEIERILEEKLPVYFVLVEAAAKDGIAILINSGFRTYAEQQALYDAFVSDPKKNAQAAKPGYSNHQRGQAFDLRVGGFDGDPVYDWLKTNGPGLGFIRTVSKEPWHWEHRPEDAGTLAPGKFKLPNVNP